MKKLIFSITMMLVFTSIYAQYYYIGSTIDEVISIEGEPNSVTDLGTLKMLSFDNGTVTFENDKVKSYRHSYNGKLKVKYKRETILPTETTPKKVSAKKEVTNKTRYIYFEYLGTGGREYDPIWQTWTDKENSYSNIYVISNYSLEAEMFLESCLVKYYKERYGKNCYLKSNVFESSTSALSLWKLESGDLIENIFCATNTQGVYKYM